MAERDGTTQAKQAVDTSVSETSTLVTESARTIDDTGPSISASRSGDSIRDPAFEEILRAVAFAPARRVGAAMISSPPRRSNPPPHRLALAG
jgi:hypothetical protein